MKPILLFDIDGTLLNVNHTFIKILIESMIKEWNLFTPPVQSRSFAGRTDRDIFFELVSESEQADKLYVDIKERYLTHMKNHFSTEDISVIDGANEIIEFAVKEKYPIGLCTGN